MDSIPLLLINTTVVHQAWFPEAPIHFEGERSSYSPTERSKRGTPSLLQTSPVG